MPSRYITFILPFNNSSEEDGYNSNFKNIYKPKKEIELDRNKEILLFKDNNLDLNSELKEGTSFINIKEYLMEMALIKPLKLSFIKISILVFNCPAFITKLYVFYNNSI
jgi:hypothetical protein